MLGRGRARWAVIWALSASSGGTLDITRGSWRPGPEQPMLRKKGSMEIDTLGMDMPRDETTLGASIRNNNSCILPVSNTLPRLNLNKFSSVTRIVVFQGAVRSQYDLI